MTKDTAAATAAPKKKITETFPSAQLRRLAARHGIKRMTRGFLGNFDKELAKRGEKIVQIANQQRGERVTIAGKDVKAAYEAYELSLQTH
jgi:histone H3/H4